MGSVALVREVSGPEVVSPMTSAPPSAVEPLGSCARVTVTGSLLVDSLLPKESSAVRVIAAVADELGSWKKIPLPTSVVVKDGDVATSCGYVPGLTGYVVLPV